MDMKHYVVMSGIRGCTPQACEVYATVSEAVEAMAELHELGPDQVDELARTYCVDLTPDQGAEYAEVVPCACVTPWVHSDELSLTDVLARLTPTVARVENGDARTVLALVTAYNGLTSAKLLEYATGEGLGLSQVKAAMALLSREGQVFQSRLGIWYPTH
jgi:hypothetical protein